MIGRRTWRFANSNHLYAHCERPDFVGAFRHTYVVSSDPHEPVSMLTQIVRASTIGAGRLLTGVFKRAFGERMPESFEELRTDIARPTARKAAA